MPVVTDSGAEQKLPRTRPPTGTAGTPTEHRVSPREAYAAPPMAAPKVPDPYAQRLGLVQHNSASLVPVRTIVDLANLSANEKEIALVARKMARQWDVSPRVFFGEQDPRKVVSQITGRPVSMKEAQRFSDYYSPVALAQMLAQTLDTSRVRRGSKDVLLTNPKRLGAFANALARNADFDLSTGLALAYQVSNGDSFSPKTFEQNLGLARAWLQGTTGKPASDEATVAVAVALSRKGTARSVGEVPTLLYGKEATATSQRVAENIQGAITYGTPEQRQKAYQEQLAGVQDIQAAGGQAIAGEITPEGMLGPDYWDQVNRIQERVRLNQDAFAHSILGKAVSFVGTQFNKVWVAQEKTLVDIGTRIVEPVAIGLGAAAKPFGYKPSPNDVFRTIEQSRQDAYVRIGGGQSVGDIVQEGWGQAPTLVGLQPVDIPDWTGTAFDFFVQWETDPFVAYGKAAKFARAGRLLPELEQPSLIRTALGNIGISQAERRLGQEALASGGDALTELSVKSGVSEYTLRALPKDVLERTVGGMLNRGPESLKLSGVFGAIAKRNDVLLDLATQRFKNYVITKLPESPLSRSLFDAAAKDFPTFARRLDVVSVGTVADRTLDYTYMNLLRNEVLKRFPQMGDDAWAAWQDGIRAHFVGWGPEGSAAEAAVNGRLYGMNADVKTLSDNLPEVFPEDFAQAADFVHNPGDGLYHPPFTAEAPGSGVVSKFGLRRQTRALVTNERFTDTAFGRKVAALPNINPGRQMPLFGADAEQYVLAHARRWTTFSESEARAYQQQALKLLGGGGGTERNLEGLITKINDEAFSRIIKPFHLNPGAEQDLRSQIFDPIRSMNVNQERAFGTQVAPEGVIAVEKPILESQLSNYLTVIDPVQVRSAIREYTGIIRRQRAHLYNALRLDAPEIASSLDNIAHRAAVGIMTGAGEGLNDLRHIWKALVIARPGYIPRVVLGDENARFLSVTQSVTERVLAAEWWGAARKLEDKGLFTQTFRDMEGNEIAKVGLPGALEMNPLATGQVRESELLADVLRRTKLQDKARAGDIRWDLLNATDNSSAHMNGWVWALNKQLPNSAPGRVALESVAAGEDVATTRARLLRWAQDDGYVTLRERIGVPVEETSDWANTVATMVHSYTAGNRDIALASLTANSKDLRAVLESANIPLASRPVVHGPTVAASTRGLEGVVGNKLINKMYDTFVRWPESHMNRQPFYKAMKRRAERGHYALLQDAARSDPSIAKLIRGDAMMLPRDGAVLQIPAKDLADITEFPTRTATLSGRTQEQMDALREAMRGGYNPAYVPPGGSEPVGNIVMEVDPATGRGIIRESHHRVGIAAELGQAVPVEIKYVDDITRSLGKDIAEVDASGAMKILSEMGGAGTEAGVPVRELLQGRGLPAINPFVRNAIDKASTEFALDQVSRVMFDFTKQSRFTELLQFIFPFPQPFFEGFQAWGHLLKRDPGIIGRANALYRAGVNTGWIKEDPISGQQVVDLKPLRWLAVQASAPFGMKDRMEGLDLVAPLTSFNMLASSTLRLPTDEGGIFGKLAGGAPIPVPSLRPELQALAQWTFRNSNNESVTSYLFQYGPSTQFLPRPLQVLANLIAPGASENDNQHKALADSLLRAYQVNHVTFQYGGQTVGFDGKGDPVNEDLLLQAVKHDATAMFSIRNVLALFSPAAPSVRTAASPMESMWQDYLNTSPDYSTALDRWTKDHPDLWLVPIGKTFYDGSTIDPRTGKEARGPRLPASRLVMEMLNTPGIGDMMKRDKAWAGLLLIGLDPTVADSQDWPTFSRLVANGTFRYKTPEQFFGEGETGRVWRDINDFYTNTWNPGRAAMDAKNLNTNDAAYTTLQNERRTFLTGLSQRFPGWVRSHLQFNQEGQYWDWPEGSPDIPTDLTLAQAKSIVGSPGFEGFPGVRALGEFLDLYDKTAAGMKTAGYTSILQDSAVSSGFTGKFADKVRNIIKGTPGIEPYLSAMFGVRLGEGGKRSELATSQPGLARPTQQEEGTSVPLPGSTLLASDILTTLPSSKYQQWQKLPTTTEEMQQRGMEATIAGAKIGSYDLRFAVDAFDTKVNVLKDAAYKQYDTGWERSQRYLDLQRYMDGTFTQDPKVINAWWKTQGIPAQKEYLAGLATKPAIFYSAFDWHLMGHDLNKDSVRAFQEVAAARIQIAKNEDADPKYASGDAYNALNVQIAARMKSNPNFAKAVGVANDWTFPLRAAELQSEPGKVGHVWSYLISSTKKIQAYAESVGARGVSGGTDAQNKWWADTQAAVLTYVHYYTDKTSSGYNEPFAKTWQDLTASIGDAIVGSIIMPDTYYGPLGTPNYGK